jgi:hypothetical protein
MENNRGGREKKEVTRKERRGNVLFSILLVSPLRNNSQLLQINGWKRRKKFPPWEIHI